jgi:hypothetical protein
VLDTFQKAGVNSFAIATEAETRGHDCKKNAWSVPS